MGKCIRCGNEHQNKKICSPCLQNWTEMRTTAWNALQKKHGEMCFANFDILKKGMKKLEAVWRKDKDKFQVEIEKLSA